LKRIDANQTEIVKALRDAGATVMILSSVGRGCPDLLIGKNGINLLAEIKNLEGRGRRLTPAEQDFIDTWRGQVTVIRNIEEALKMIEE
jgi:hypothetical protein